MEKLSQLKNNNNLKRENIGNQIVYLQNTQLQSYDKDNCMFCKFFLNIERDSDILILSGRLFHCLPAWYVKECCI